MLKNKHKLIIGISGVIAIVLAVIIASLPVVSVAASTKVLSVDIQDEYAVIKAQQLKFANRYNGITSVTTESWGYRYQLSNGDIVEVGNNPSAGFQPMVKAIRWDNSVWFSLSLQSSATFASTLNGLVTSFDFNNNIKASIYPVEPSTRLPEGGIEYDIQLLKRPAQNTVTFNIDWAGITWTKILPLNVEYNEAKCADVFGVQGSPYVLTATSIIGSDGVTYKTRPEYEVNSYLGTAVDATRKPSIIGTNPSNGQPIVRYDVSTTDLYIHRGQMTDALGNKAWVEDINIDQTAKTITFTLPSTWLKNATYPVSQVCGVDPAYTQKMGSFQSSALAAGDAKWDEYDLTTLAGDSVVAEIILSNSTTGTENTMGVSARAADHTATTSTRLVTLHEAEGGGQTHCRMFVQTNATGLICARHSDISDDDYFYVVGYWTNVTFTETFGNVTPGGSGWVNITGLTANRVYQFLLSNEQADTAHIMGLRTDGSALGRSITVHEPEAGGASILDMLVKADASGIVESYRDEATTIYIYNLGYFGSEMDFVELWESNQGIDAFADWDLTAYLDADGRMADFLFVHTAEAATATMAVRGGDDTTTARTLVEHEAESAGAGGEYTGFGMSAQSNASGVVHVQLPATTSWAYLTGYFKPASSYNITETTTSKAFGVVAVNTTYWAIGHTPDNPINDAHCTFIITNSGLACDLDIKMADFTGGVGWNIEETANPGADEVMIYAFYSGNDPAAGLIVKNADQEFYDGLAVSAHIHWELKMVTGTSFTDGAAKSGILTITATVED